MFRFELKKTKIYRSLLKERLLFLGFSGILKKFSLAFFVIIFLIFIYGFVPNRFSEELSKKLLGFSFILVAVYLFFLLVEVFFNEKIKKPPLLLSLQQASLTPEKYNIAEFLSFESAKSVLRSIETSDKDSVSSSRLLYFILKENPSVNFVFYRALVNSKGIEELLKNEINREKKEKSFIQEDLLKCVLTALKIASQKNHQRIETGDIILALTEINLVFQKFLIENRIKPEDIANLILWQENIKEKINRQKRFWEYENLARKGTLAKQWTSGYTILLDKFSQDITNQIKGQMPDFISHKKQTEIVERILSGTENNNVLLIGEPGSGRKSIVEGLAQRSLLGKGLAETNYKRVVELDMQSLLAQTQSQDDLEQTLGNIFGEIVEAGNIILLIDEFHNYVGQTARPGVIDISGIIAPYLKIPQFQFIAITDYEGFHKNIERTGSLLSLFEKVEVQPVSPKESLLILESLVPFFEAKYRVFISYPALRDIISLSERYLPALSFPEKAINVLDELVVTKSASKEKYILPEDVAKIITEKTKIPVGQMQEKEKEILLNLEDLIHQRIINQDEAVKEVSTALRRARSEITIRKGPIGCFLFLGPTGVGKTETSKALAEFYFGSEKRMIRLDMSEFQEVKDISRLIGSVSETGFLVSQIRENPFSLLLLDEIEKAHPNILNLFLQVLDEGYLTDGVGRKVDFKNNIIIATSNAGYKIILEAIEKEIDWQKVKQNLLNQLFSEGIFKPELINRFDSVVVFKPLSKENLLGISELLLQALKKNLKQKDIDFIITQELKEKIVDLGYNPIFGAREMRRVVQDKIENVLAKVLISGELKRGMMVKIDPENFKLVVGK